MRIRNIPGLRKTDFWPKESKGCTKKWMKCWARSWPALIEIVRGKLSINKPGHDRYDFSTEVSSGTDR